MSKIWRFTLIGRAGGGIAAEFDITQHYQTDVGITGSEPSAATMLDKILSHYSSSAHNLSKFTVLSDTGTAYVRATVYERVDPGSGDPPESAVETLSLSGSRSAPTDRLPAGLAPWLKATTAKAGKSFRGGTHGPPLVNPVDLDGNGFLDTGVQLWTDLTSLGTAYKDVINDIDAAGTDLVPVIYSLARARRGLDPTEQITACAPQRTPRWVRRRMTAP